MSRDRRDGASSADGRAEPTGLGELAARSIGRDQREAADRRRVQAAERAEWVRAQGVEADREWEQEVATGSAVDPEIVRRIARRLASEPLSGCAVCEQQAYTGGHQSYLVDSLVRQTRLWRCAQCGTFWEEVPREVHALADDEVAQLYPDWWAEAHGGGERPPVVSP